MPNKKIFLVEDDYDCEESTLKELRELFEDTVEICVFSSVAEVLENFAKMNNVCLLITELRLPFILPQESILEKIVSMRRLQQVFSELCLGRDYSRAGEILIEIVRNRGLVNLPIIVYSTYDPMFPESFFAGDCKTRFCEKDFDRTLTPIIKDLLGLS